MCYSNSLSTKVKAFQDRFNLPELKGINLTPIYHVSAFTFPTWPVITKNGVENMNWGLIPDWFSGNVKEIQAKTLNAKSETAFEKASFKENIINRHCLIPSSGFFEWQTVSKKKHAHFIKSKESEIFTMAGIYSEWNDTNSGEIIKTFSMLTSPANELMAEIHNTKERMPLILSPHQENDWLTKSAQGFEDIPHPVSSDKLISHTIDKRIILSTDSNRKEAQEYYEYPFEGEQGSLF